MIEEWKVVPEFSKYEASTTGLIRDSKTKELRPLVWNNNFLCTNMHRDDGIKQLSKVHRIVALTFLDNPENAHNVIHINEDRSNNSVDNLKWKPKLVRQVISKEVPTLTFLNRTYTYAEFCEEAKCEISTLKNRLKAGWSVRECFTGIREFVGEGYSGEGMWFTNKKECQAWMWLRELDRREMKRKQKEEDREQRLKERSEYKKYGVGVFENFPVKGIVDRVTTKAYRAWDAMLARCYGVNKESYAAYGAVGVRVCDEWLIFQNYVKWYDAQYKEDDWHVDKDIILVGNKLYSPDNCTMVPPLINTFFATLPKGSPSVFEKSGKFLVQGKNANGERTYSWCATEEDAIQKYWEDKIQTAKDIANKYYGKIDMRVFYRLVDFKPT